MSRRAWESRAAAIAMLLWSCSREKVGVLAHLDQPPVDLVRVDRKTIDAECAGGHGIGICVPERRDRTFAALRTQGRPRLPLLGCPTAATTGELVSAPDRQRIAYRCNQGDWSVVLLGKSGTLFDGPRAIGAQLDWSPAPALPDALGALWKQTIWATEHQALAREAVAWGPDAVAAMLVDAADIAPMNAHDDTWEQTYAALEPRARALVDHGLEARATAGATSPLLARAALHANLAAPVLAARLDEVLSREHGELETTPRVLMLALLAADKHLAASKACSLFDRPSSDDCASRTWELFEAAALALVDAHAPCPALPGWLARAHCNVAACEPAPDCTPDALARRAASTSRTNDAQALWSSWGEDPTAALLTARQIAEQAK